MNFWRSFFVPGQMQKTSSMYLFHTTGCIGLSSRSVSSSSAMNGLGSHLGVFLQVLP